MIDPPRIALIGALLSIAASAEGAASPAAAQRAAEAGLTPSAIPLYDEELGSFAWPVTTTVRRAQEYFDQGARLVFAYATGPAQQSFEEATRLDPACAMCWWGVVWAMGPNFNSGFATRDSLHAREAVQRAAALAPGATPVEQALIAAMGVRHGLPAGGPDTSRVPRNAAYAEAMAAVYHRFPDNPEVATLYADALMLLEPRRGAWPIEKPSVRRIHQVLEGVLANDPGHPGACHAYLHATETTPRVVEAQRCADLLGGAIPRASHINHMPSHTYNRVGRWGDATLANLEAWETDRRAEKGEGFAIYPSHNLHMLLFSAAVDGQGELAIGAATEYGKYDDAGSIGFQALLLARFGHFERLLDLRDAPTGLLPRGYWHFGRGLAHLRAGRADSAVHYLERLDSVTASTPESHRFRVHPAAHLLRIVGSILRGEIARKEGRMEAAIASLEEAVATEQGLMYDEPEPIPLLARDYLGAALLEAGRAEEAERVYRAALEARPRNGWSLFGLEQALRAQGRGEEADEVTKELERAWARADVLLAASRF